MAYPNQLSERMKEILLQIHDHLEASGEDTASRSFSETDRIILEEMNANGFIRWSKMVRAFDGDSYTGIHLTPQGHKMTDDLKNAE